MVTLKQYQEAQRKQRQEHGKKGGAIRWKKITDKKKRSNIMKKVSDARWKKNEDKNETGTRGPSDEVQS